MLSHFSDVWFFSTLWTVACQPPVSMGFSRQEYWSGLPCPPPGDLPDLGIKPTPLMSLALAGGFFITSATWEALILEYSGSLSSLYKNFKVEETDYSGRKIFLASFCGWKETIFPCSNKDPVWPESVKLVRHGLQVGPFLLLLEWHNQNSKRYFRSTRLCGHTVYPFRIVFTTLFPKEF